MSDFIDHSTPEDRFKTIGDFNWCIRCGGEIVFTYHNKVFGIAPQIQRTENSPVQILISQIYTENAEQTEKWCDTADAVLEYRIDGDRLRDIITQVEVVSRTI